MRTLRIVLSLLVAAYLALAPRYLLPALGEDKKRALFEEEAPDWYGVIEIWHIVDFRTYQGSVTKFLRDKCDAFAARRDGVHIEVTGMTQAAFFEHLLRGQSPDAYSFACGALYREQLRDAPAELPALCGNLAGIRSEGGALLAAPYLMSGYFLLLNEQRVQSNGSDLPSAATADVLQAFLSEGELVIPPVLAARLGLTGQSAALEDFLSGKRAAAVADARVLGDLERSQAACFLLYALPFGAYTEQVQYLGAARGTDDRRAALIGDLIAYLLSPPVQQELAALGALPVAADPGSPVYGSDLLGAWRSAYASPVSPAPLPYQRHRDALAADALAAMEGTPAATAAFFERMAVVLDP